MTISRFEASDARNDEAEGRSKGAGRSDDSVRLFVEHWGMMARSWGINATMGELFALLYISGEEWTADSLKEWLDVSRGNVSMNLRELMSWGVVHKVHRQGERREFYRAETDVWTLFRRILFERKRRELDPTLIVLEQTVRLIEAEGVREPQADLRTTRLERIASLQRFFDLINRLATRLLTFEPDELDDLLRIFDGEEDQDPPV